MIEWIPDMVLILDLNGNILHANSAAEKLTGYGKEELLRMNIEKILSDSDAGKAYEMIENVLKRGHIIVELKKKRKDGTFYDAEVHAKLIDYEGKKAVLLIERDITLRKKLEEELEVYRRIFENSNDGIAIIDPNGYYVKQNSAHRQLIGYSDEELMGQTPAIHLGEETFSKIFKELQEKGTFRGEVVCYGKNGDPKFIELSAFPLRDRGGNIVCYVGIKRDITERKKIEQKLRESREKYRLIVENSRDVIATLDSDGRITYISPSVEKVLGYKPEEMIGKSVFENIHPDERDFVKAQFYSYPNERSVDRIIHRYRRKDGKWIWMESIGSPIFSDGNFVGGVVIARDVTERIELEKRLRESEMKYKGIANLLQCMIEISPIAITAWDLNYRIILWNKTAERMFGWGAEEVIEKDLFELYVPEKERKRIKKVLEEVLNGKSTRIVSENHTKDGRELIVEWFSMPIRDADGNIVGGASFGIDLTERIKMEKEIKESEEKLRKIFENSPDMIAIISREGVFIEANPAMVESIGFNPVGKNLFEVFPEKVAKKRFELVKKALQRNKPLTVEDSRDGRYFLTTLIPMKLPIGKHCLVMAKEMTELIRLNKLLNAINNIGKLIVHENEKLTLLQKACRELASLEEYSTVTINLIEDGKIVPVSVIGKERTLEMQRECEMIKRVAKYGVMVASSVDDCKGCVMHSMIKEFKQVLFFPMIVDNEVKGVLTLYLATEKRLSEKEIELLQTMANDLAFAVKTIELDELKRKAFEQIERNIEQFAILVDQIRNPLAAIVGLAELKIDNGDVAEKIIEQARRIENLANWLEKGWLESEEVREFLKKHVFLS
jgi:PAS domain S-box-containing protein